MSIRLSREYNDTNLPLAYEDLAGEGLAPFLINDEEVGADRPYPTVAPHHYNEEFLRDATRQSMCLSTDYTRVGVAPGWGGNR